MEKSKIKKIPVGKFNMATKCYICKGVGLDVCPVCFGRKTENGRTCSECNGRGMVKCYACQGTGVVD
ncbi:hypothetical protein [Floccifex sp.]|uniref:hypothetical protein n=1 Tax=Floccifex sp. TaxID=2815810 RepID=UPI002A75FA98|nr:hypothetical protein [Floccifex sp.]MDD7282223.1 hypothetical protein [Erysipelotrichaceae bacterium]MDY2957748.1 hypothetical protein [Floccifex sp.]